MKEPRISMQTLQVLQTFLLNWKLTRCCGEVVNEERAVLSGIDISRMTKIGAGTVYPTLSRLEKAGWLKGDWEKSEPSKLGRPRRKLYRLTSKGQSKAIKLLRTLGAVSDALGPSGAS